MKAKASAPSSSTDEPVSQEVADLKAKGNNLFASGDYAKALDAYDEGLKHLKDGGPECAVLHSNKAACYIQMKRFKDADRSCTAALTASPGNSKALQRRARAYEQQGLYKQALADIQQVNRGESASTETKEIEKRLKDVLSGRRRGVADIAGARAGRGAGRWPRMVCFTAKCMLDDDARLVHLAHGTSYAELLELVRAKFPGLGPVALKYVDKEGDLVTIGERADVSAAIAECVAAYEKQLGGAHGPRLPPQIPPIKIQLFRVAEGDAPKPPEAEVAERAQLLAAQKSLAARAAAGQAGRAGEEEAVYEIDDWLLDFANLFRESLGIEPDRHVEMHNIGVEKCQRALEAAIHSDKALPIFDEAAEKFKEVTCVGLLNWGNVHLCVGHKLAGEAATAGKDAASVEAEVLGWFDKAQGRYDQAMELKEDFYDGILALAQLEFERAKVKVGLIIEPPVASGSGEGTEEQDVNSAAALNEAMKKALAKVDMAKVAEVQPLVDKCWELYKKGVKLGEDLDVQGEKEKEKRAETGRKPAEPTGEGADEPGLQTHALVMWANVQFEYSQILAVSGGEWRPILDEAVVKFRKAGCNEKDVIQALRSHIKAEELDIPEDPPEEPKDAAAASAESAPPVKGLPSLGSKPAKKAE
eukprot:evm.model.scf_2126.1 EVM.evm.TU.scf_2126.1   scf_2126:13698-15628(-)